MRVLKRSRNYKIPTYRRMTSVKVCGRVDTADREGPMSPGRNRRPVSFNLDTSFKKKGFVIKMCHNELIYAQHSYSSFCVVPLIPQRTVRLTRDGHCFQKIYVALRAPAPPAPPRRGLIRFSKFL
ncbi:hypothetical protein EVAR_55902_1 [Eumeta japonica]|uniref:Uncharacterized protein n=1 Tax=Eumeta variegata TaxID=151549 RepID=A0A4C1YNR5_EUMVA|nr:hypothetical protein EVAR_55902_1 [Eumeta japonica]